MKLERIAIKNFKSISPNGIEIVFKSGLVVLVGKNNAGKSNILEASGLLFGNKNPRYVSIPPESFNDPSQGMIIEAEFSGLTWGDGRQLGLSDRQCGSLTHEGKRVETAAGHVTLRLTVPPPESDEVDSEDDDEEAVQKRSFEVFLANRHELKRNEDLRKALIKYLIVPSVRDHSDLLAPSTWTAYGHMLRAILSDSEQRRM